MQIPAGALLAGAAALFLSAAAAIGQTNTLASAQATDRVSDHFIALAGSEANATALVTGLINGTAINLTSTANGQTTTTTTTITPPAGTMSARSAFTALALAEADLTKLGVAQPTSADIQAALTGGSVTTGSGSSAVTTKLTGVLVLSQQGQTYAQIAQSLGVDLQTAITTAQAVTDTSETAEGGQPEEARSPAAARVTDRVADHFEGFAGSEANATALVNGLTNGTAIDLTSTANGQTATTTITPPTGPMSARNAFTALALAEADLTKLGVTQPTAADIQAALTGGSVTTGSGTTAVTTTLQGVLVLSHQGQSYAQIAQTLGVDLQTAVATARTAADTGETAEAGQPAETPQHPISPRAADRIADHFVTFAGSEANATSLANGLSNGTAVTLTSTVNGQAVTTTFTPPTGQLGAHNAFLALSLAEADLTKLGDTQPTAADIEAALNGGSVTTGSGSTAVTTKLTGILVLQNQGQTFAQISQTLGVNLQTAVATARSAADTGELAEAGVKVTDRLADRFATFAGGETNSTALVNGLRDGTAVTLTTTVNGQTTTTTFTPTTGQMGYGNVLLSLALAENKLSALGITQPTPAEIEAALNGGSVTTGSGTAAVTTQLPGVLALRSQGQGFGQIAQTLGVSMQTAIADARMGTDAGEAAEKGQEVETSADTASPKTVAVAMAHMDADADDAHAASPPAGANPIHVDVAVTAHPETPAMVSHPDVGAAVHAMSGFHVPPTMPVRPPEMPMHPEIPPRPEIPHIPEMPHRD